MEVLNYPLLQLTEDVAAAISSSAAAAEEARRLLPGQLQVAYNQNWFKMLVPKQYGGLELSLPNEVRLIEAISCADGSMGWTVTLCAGAGWFGGFTDPHLSAVVFANPQVCLAGSGAPAGTAEETASGYLVNGTWNYASGALHATHFTANCYITKNGAKVLGEDGEPVILPFIFNATDVEVITAWNYIGLTATGSHSFKVNNLAVNSRNCFKIDPAFARVNSPLYQYPFYQLAEATLAVNIAGMAIHFIHLTKHIFAGKVQNKALSAAQQAELHDVRRHAIEQMNTLRKDFYHAVDHSWEAFVQHHSAGGQALMKVSKTSRALSRGAINLVDELYRYCGLTAASTLTEINRVWRDIHTASQHSLLTFSI